MKGIARVYDHVTPAMVNQILDVLEERWLRSLASLYPGERAKLVSWFPHLRSRRTLLARDAVAISSPSDDRSPVSPGRDRASDLLFKVVRDTGIEPVTSSVSGKCGGWVD